MPPSHHAFQKVRHYFLPFKNSLTSKFTDEPPRHPNQDNPTKKKKNYDDDNPFEDRTATEHEPEPSNGSNAPASQTETAYVAHTFYVLTLTLLIEIKNLVLK